MFQLYQSKYNVQVVDYQYLSNSLYGYFELDDVDDGVPFNRLYTRNTTINLPQLGINEINIDL